MPPFERFLASMLTPTNENTAAFISAKIDFTLFKFDPPAEYLPIGPALTSARRSDAEIGPIHRTARRLAALFEQVIPSTPKLVAAYGKRVSSLITRSDVNPKGSAKDGPFQPFVGADGTAMWAAATSGTGALGVYLLACFLARLWDSKYAISIWVEIIENRRGEIKAGLANGENVSESALMSTMQEITRHDLAIWDASARSWIHTADQVKSVERQLIQLNIITKDLMLPFCSGPTTYSKVICSWINAMQGMENLLNGMPQKIQNASILTAFSSWHLFPDLIALSSSTTKIPFNDELFPENALGTIGLSAIQPTEDSGIQWSLVLSHLHYYGPPVEATTYASEPKITFARFRLVALGSLFARWRLNHRHYIEAAEFLSTLWEILLELRLSQEGLSLTYQFGWLYVFVQAANDLILARTSSKSVFEDHMRLIKFGPRRGTSFLGPQERLIQPFFGLLNKAVLSALTAPSEVDASINYLRCISEDSALDPQDAVILCGHWGLREYRDVQPDLYEFATIVSVQRKSKKRKPTEEPSVSVMTGHWFAWRSVDDATTISQNSRAGAQAKAREEHLEKLGAYFTNFPWQRHKQVDHNNLVWSLAPQIFAKEPNLTALSTSVSSLGSKKHIRVPHWMRESDQDVAFTIVKGTWACGLAVKEPRKLKSDTQLEIREAISCLKQSANRKLLCNFLGYVLKESWSCGSQSPSFSAPPDDVGLAFVAKDYSIPSSVCMALHSLALADLIFESIEASSISLECLDFPLHEARWLSGIQKWSAESTLQVPLPIMPTREEAFTCICFFDSGTIILDANRLTGVLAMCSNNSIYVSGIALADPASQTGDHVIQHIRGNIGRGGISMLVAPKNPQIRKASQDYRIINHLTYDFKHEDNFRDTTLHLSFTDWVVPLEDHVERTIDHEVYFIESVISVCERGNWVADLDILSIDFPNLNIMRVDEEQLKCSCEPVAKEEMVKSYDITAVDSWDELLDEPQTTCIVRAHGNWAARLAATSILYQQGQGHAVCILQKLDSCICCEMTRREHIGNKGLEQYEANLPHFLID